MNNKKIIKIKESPEFWQNAINGLPEEVQATVAKVVWWDHFASRLVSERWPHLDEWLNKPIVDISQEDWVKHLTRIGYTHNEAASRCTEQRFTGRTRNPAPNGRTGTGQVETQVPAHV